MPTPTIRRLRRATQGSQLSVSELRQDPSTRGLGLEQADANEDGQILEDEIDVLWSHIDRLDGRADGRIGRSGRRAAAAVVRRMGHADLAAEVETHRGRDITMIGTTGGSLREVHDLRQRNAVDLIDDIDSPAERVRVDGRLLDLESRHDRIAFVQSLALPASVTWSVLRVLDGVAAERRETLPNEPPAPPGRGLHEVGELARQWSAAYHGAPESIPSRLVISGHGDGDFVFESHGDVVSRHSIVALAAAMPEAAAQIEHIHIGACQHGYQTRMQPYMDAFPALESVWGYAGFAPSGYTSVAHQRAWERSTRPEGSGPAREDVAGLRRHVATAVWRRGEDWEGPPVRDFGEIVSEANGGQGQWNRMLAGDIEGGGPGEDSLATQEYLLMQELTAHHDFADQDPEFRQPLMLRRQQSLRLRFFDSHVMPTFAQHYRRILSASYVEVGLEQPNWTDMSRMESVDEAARFHAAYEAAGRPAAARSGERVLRGLATLDPETIPLAWL